MSRQRGTLNAVLALAALAAGGSDALVATPSGLERRRSRPEPWRSPLPPPVRSSTPPPLSAADAERVQLADEKRARKGARREASVAKGAIRRAGT